MQSLMLLADIGSGLADTGSRIVTEFGLNWQNFLAQCLSFSIVAFCLHRFAYHPIQRVLESRQRRIAESLANADKIKAELARTETQRQEVMTQAKAQAARFIEEAHAATPACWPRKPRKPSLPLNRLWPRPERLPHMTMLECSPNSKAKWAGWS